MKKYFFLFFLSIFFSIAIAQVNTDARTEEYATVRAIISAQTGSFSNTTTLPNPFLEMEGASTELKDQVKDIKGVRFATVTDMINYMNKFSWILLSTSTMEIAGSKTNDYMVLYTFKRKPKSK